MNNNEIAFLTVVRLGIGTRRKLSLPAVVDWNEIKGLAERQGLSAIVIDGID